MEQRQETSSTASHTTGQGAGGKIRPCARLTEKGVKTLAPSQPRHRHRRASEGILNNLCENTGENVTREPGKTVSGRNHGRGGCPQGPGGPGPPASLTDSSSCHEFRTPPPRCEFSQLWLRREWMTASRTGLREQLLPAPAVTWQPPCRLCRTRAPQTISTRAGGEGRTQARPGSRSFAHQLSRSPGDAVFSPVSPETTRPLEGSSGLARSLPSTLTERLPLTVGQLRTSPGPFLKTSASLFSRQLETEQRPRKEPR